MERADITTAGGVQSLARPITLMEREAPQVAEVAR